MTPKKIVAFAFGPIAGALLSFMTLPMITWFFSQEDIGRMAMLNVVISFSILLFSFGLDQAYVREFHESNNKPALFKAALLPGLLVLLLTLGVLLSFDNIISIWLFNIDSHLLSVMVAIALLSTFISRFLSLILRMNEQGMAFSMSQVLPKILLVSIIGCYVIFSVAKDIDHLVLANVASILFVCIVFGWNTRKEWLSGLKEKINFAYLKKLLRFGFPLIFGGLSFWGLTATDKILLKELSDFEQLGLYSVAVSFAAVATIFQSIFSTVWAPTVYKWAALGEGLENIDKVTRYVLLVVIIMFCLVGLFSWVVPIILPESYEGVQWLLISCLGYPLLYTLSETTVIGIGVTKRTGLALLAAFLAFTINLLGNRWLIPGFGAVGASISTCFSFLVFFVLRTEFSIHVWRPIPRFILYSYIAMLVIGAITNTLYGKSYISLFLIYWCGVLLSTLFVFKSEMLSIAGFISERIYIKQSRDGGVK